jgi:DNA topoisomerase-1
LIQTDFGDKYLPAKPIRYAAGKMAQEAHEAVRPTELKFSHDAIKSHLTHDQYKLYQLIYRRFVASQMNPAIFEVTNVEVTAGEGLFKAQARSCGSTVTDASCPPRASKKTRSCLT